MMFIKFKLQKRDICEHMCALQQWNTTLPHQSLLSEIWDSLFAPNFYAKNQLYVPRQLKLVQTYLKT